MEHPKVIGDRSTLAIMLALEARGYLISVPFGENTRYDLVIDDGQQLQRVQCKTGRLRFGAVKFRTRSSYIHLPSPKERYRSYHGEVDSFAVFCPDTGGVYLIPIARLPTVHEASLRVDPPRNGQLKGVRLARDYEVAVIDLGGAQPPSRELRASAGGR